MSRELLQRVISLEAFFRAGLEEATGLRKELERETSPAPRKGLSEAQKAIVVMKRSKRVPLTKKAS